MRDATSLADRTTESGPVARFSLSTLVCVLDRALGVGAPTPVSVTGGSWVERVPMTCAARMATPSSASRANPLRQPFTVSHVVHRTSGLERALHQVDCHDYRRRVEAQIGQGRFELVEASRARCRPRPPQRDMRPEGPSLRRETQRRELLLHAVLQQLERRLRRDTHPDDAWTLVAGEHAEPTERQ